MGKTWAKGHTMATGGSKAIKELENEQKTRQTRMSRDVMMVRASSPDALINKEFEIEINAVAAKTKPQNTIKRSTQ